MELCVLQGLSQVEAGRQLGVNKATVCRHLQKGQAGPAPGGGLCRAAGVRALRPGGFSGILVPEHGARARGKLPLGPAAGKPRGITAPKKKGKGWALWRLHSRSWKIAASAHVQGWTWTAPSTWGEPVPLTKGFLRRVRRQGRDFCFFTNNSSKNREAYLEKLARMGISLPEKMLISNGVILQWLGRHHPGARCYVVGTPALQEDFRKVGFAPDAEDGDRGHPGL